MVLRITQLQVSVYDELNGLGGYWNKQVLKEGNQVAQPLRTLQGFHG